jgi:hypothetical protein
MKGEPNALSHISQTARAVVAACNDRQLAELVAGLSRAAVNRRLLPATRRAADGLLTELYCLHPEAAEKGLM